MKERTPIVATKTETRLRTKTDTSTMLEKYIESVASVNKYTAYEYWRRLIHFASFVTQKYDISLDELVKQRTCMKCGELNYLIPHAFWNITDFGARCENHMEADPVRVD